MMFKKDFNLGADGLVGALSRGRLGGVIVATARDAEGGTDAAQAVGGGVVDRPD